jgi:hypothetical protein
VSGFDRRGRWPKVAFVTRRRILAAELLQFLVAGVVFVVLAVAWLWVVYLPGRTLERWEDQRPGRRGD